MTGFSIKTATTSNADQAIGTMVLAFGADPAARWLYRDPHQYLAYFPSFVQAFAGKSFEHHGAYYVDEFAGASLWLPPGIHPNDDTVFELLQKTVPERNLAVVFAVFEQMNRYHPTEPHWYLPMIGVDPNRQRKGFGSALLEHALQRCDLDEKLAYLESSNSKNIPLYERHGFELLGTIQVGKSPSIFPMLRRPR
jgi:ribosomal protein S18 acetylase RimI-like enzyme